MVGLVQRLMANSARSTLLDRHQLANTIGKYFPTGNGTYARDVYDAAGYPRVITDHELLERLERQDIAGRVVEAKPQRAWKRMPELLDGMREEDADQDGEFSNRWFELTSGSVASVNRSEPLNMLSHLQELDRLCGATGYALMVIGFNDGGDLIEEIPQGSASEIAYLSTYDSTEYEVVEWDRDPESERYRLPTHYRITDTTGEVEDSFTVHWTRTVEASNGLRGVSRMTGVLNRLIDLEKIMAGSGESAWRLVNKGLIISTKDGYKLDPNDEARSAELEEFVHGLTRTLELEGMDVTIAGGEIVDPLAIVRANLQFISSRTGIPYRILIGSEEAQLAGEQDDEHWMEQVRQHQSLQAEPHVLRPFVHRIVRAGVLPPPVTGFYVVKWDEDKHPDPVEQATIGKTVAEILTLLKLEVEPEAFVTAYLVDLDPNSVEVKEPAPLPPALAQAAGLAPSTEGTPPDQEDGQGPEEDEDIPTQNSHGGTTPGGVRFWWRY